MLFVFLVSYLLLPTSTFMALMRRRLILMLVIVSTYWRLQEFTSKRQNMKSSRSVKDKNLHARLHWQRMPVVRQMSKGNFKCELFYFISYIHFFFKNIFIYCE